MRSSRSWTSSPAARGRSSACRASSRSAGADGGNGRVQPLRPPTIATSRRRGGGRGELLLRLLADAGGDGDLEQVDAAAEDEQPHDREDARLEDPPPLAELVDRDEDQDAQPDEQ